MYCRRELAEVGVSGMKLPGKVEKLVSRGWLDGSESGKISSPFGAAKVAVQRRRAITFSGRHGRDMLSRSRGEKTRREAPAAEEALRFIDLFSGCGGFTLGMQRAGLRAVAALDSNAEAVATYKANLPHVPHVLQRDLTTFGPEALAEVIGTTTVDVVIGGPPCQGFSTARQRDGANHGDLRLIDDPRRHLYKEFLKYVAYFRPMLFVMENVLGIRTAAGGEYFLRVHEEARALGYRVHSQVEDAWELGAPQKRRRQLFIGVRIDVPGYFPTTLTPAARATPRPPLGAAISDLPVLRAGSGQDEAEYDFARRNRFLARGGSKARRFLYSVVEIRRTERLTNHVARPHSARDLRDFGRLKEGESSAAAMRNRNVSFEFPYDKTSFKDRYTRQSRSKPCSTIVAHLSKDGLMFIHPTQNRSLTPREAARVQTFPDWFRFPRARTHAFRLIGNAVPPIVSEAIGMAVADFLRTGKVADPDATRHLNTRGSRRAERLADIPAYGDAVSQVAGLAECDARALLQLDAATFASGWRSLLFLLPHLHPAGALEATGPERPWVDADRVVPGLRLRDRTIYAATGWPVPLVRIGREAWRRYRCGDLPLVDYYCVRAQAAGTDDAEVRKRSALPPQR